MLIQIKEKNDILLMYQMTEPCTKIIKHGLQSSFLIVLGVLVALGVLLGLGLHLGVI